MSLKSKIEAVVYASEEPVTLAQLVILLSEEAQSELDALAARQTELPLGDGGDNRAENDSLPVGDAPPVIGEAGTATPEPTSLDREGSSSILTAESAMAAEHAFTTDGVGEPANSDPAISGEPANPTTEADKRLARERDRAVRDYLRSVVDALIREYADADRGVEIREVAGGFRFGTKPEYHDAVRGFVKSLKPALKLSLQALETLAVVAYKQPVTAAEISEIRGVDSAGVLGGLLTRKLIQTAGRKQVIGRPMLYKTTREFLVRFGLRDIQELPSMEEFERMAGELAEQEDLPMEATEHVIERANARGDAEHIRTTNEADPSGDEASSPAEEAGASPSSADESTDGSPDESRTGTHGERSTTADESSPRSEASPAATQPGEPGGTEQDPS